MRTGSWQRKGRQCTWQDANRILLYFICLIWHCSERKGSQSSFLGLWFYLGSESSETSRLEAEQFGGFGTFWYKNITDIIQPSLGLKHSMSEAAQKYSCRKMVKWATEAHVTLLFRGYITQTQKVSDDTNKPLRTFKWNREDLWMEGTRRGPIDCDIRQIEQA